MPNNQDINDVLMAPATPGESTVLTNNAPQEEADKPIENAGGEPEATPTKVEDGETQGDGGRDNTPKPTEEVPAQADTTTPVAKTDKEIKSYNSLRVKLQEQGREKNLLKEEADTLKSKLNDISEELGAYKTWYDKYYPVLNKLMQDENIKDKVEQDIKPKTLTIDEANSLFDKRLKEKEEMDKYKRDTDAWFEKHQDVKGQIATDMNRLIKEQNLNPNVETLDMLYAYLVKPTNSNNSVDTSKADMEKKIQEEKLKSASIAGGAGAIPTKISNPVDDLFSVPASRYYPGV